jgi:uncharacterized protein (TIGR02147 family)
MKMEAQVYLQKKIIEYFDGVKTRNPSYSLRALARDLGVQPSSLSEFLNGKRRYSQKMLRKLASILSLAPEEIQELVEKIVRDIKRVDHTIETSKEVLQLNSDQYYLVADWHYYALLCLAETPDFKEDVEFIAKRLKTTPKKMTMVLERLKRLGFLYYNSDQKLVVKDIELKTTEDVPSTALKKRHDTNLQAARDSLYQDDVLMRDFSFATIAIDPTKLPEAKKMIREFQDQLITFLQDGTKTEVYELCTQLFPKTEITKEIFYENFKH